MFYRDVLPGDVAAARRLLQLRVAQLARRHQIPSRAAWSTPENIKGSDLSRLQASIALVGRYGDVRDFLYELETADDFVVVDSIVLAEGDETGGAARLHARRVHLLQGRARCPLSVSARC